MQQNRWNVLTRQEFIVFEDQQFLQSDNGTSLPYTENFNSSAIATWTSIILTDTIL